MHPLKAKNAESYLVKKISASESQICSLPQISKNFKRVSDVRPKANITGLLRIDNLEGCRCNSVSRNTI